MSDDAPDNLPAPVDQPEGGARLGELEVMMADTRGPYWNSLKAPALQQEYRDLLDKQEPGQGETDDGLMTVSGIATPTLADVRAMVPELDDAAATDLVNTVMTIAELVPEEDRVLFDASVAALPEITRVAIVAELKAPPPENTPEASDNVIKTLEAKGLGPLLAEWGIGAKRRVGIANARVNSMIDRLPSDEAAKEFTVWFDNQSAGEMTAILRMIA